MRKAQLIGEIAGEFLLPLLGFLFWDWDLYFILLFILFDYLLRIAYALWRPEVRNKFALIRPALFFITFVIISHFYMVLTDPTWRFTPAFSAFFWYEDFYIPQGFVLIPLLFYTEYSRQRMEIVLNGSFDPSGMIKKIAQRLVLATVVFMIMSVLLTLTGWSKSTETIFFLSSWLVLILFENRRAFLTA